MNCNRLLSDHVSCLFAMSPQVFHQSILVLCEVIRIYELIAPFDFIVVVVEGFSLDVLILACENLVSNAQIDGCLLVCNWFNKSFNLIVIVSMTDSSPSQNHINDLFHSPVSLILELMVNR